MTEPTDHRAEAERDIAMAATSNSNDELTSYALLAIAHDLHRIADALELQPEHEHAWTGANSTAGFLLVCSRCGATRRDAIADDQPGPGNVEADFTEDGVLIAGRCDARHLGLRCVFWAGHKDSHHRGTWTSE